MLTCTLWGVPDAIEIPRRIIMKTIAFLVLITAVVDLRSNASIAQAEV